MNKGKDAKKLRGIAKNIKATVRIGKNGLSKGLIEEIKKQVKKKGIVKVKLLRPALEQHDKEEIIGVIEKETKAKAVMSIGLTLCFYKKSAGIKKEKL